MATKGKKADGFVERMKSEHEELVARLAKLDKFWETETAKEIDHENYVLLKAQQHAMETYRVILEARIDRNS